MKTFAVIRYFDLSKGKTGLIAKHRASAVGGGRKPGVGRGRAVSSPCGCSPHNRASAARVLSVV